MIVFYRPFICLVIKRENTGILVYHGFTDFSAANHCAYNTGNVKHTGGRNKLGNIVKLDEALCRNGIENFYQLPIDLFDIIFHSATP